MSRLGSARSASRNCLALVERRIQVCGIVCGIVASEKANGTGIAIPRDAEHGLGLPLERDRRVIDDKEPGVVQAYVGAQIPREQGVLRGGVVAEKQNGRRRRCLAQRGRALASAIERAHKGGIIRGAVVIDVVGSKNGTGKLLQQIVLFIGGAIGADHPDRAGRRGSRESRAAWRRHARAPAPSLLPQARHSRRGAEAW